MSHWRRGPAFRYRARYRKVTAQVSSKISSKVTEWTL